DTRIAGAAADHFEDALGVEPRLCAEHDRLRGRRVMHRDEQVRDKFHAAAIAESTEIMADPRKAGEGVTAARIGRLVAAAIEREIAGDGLRAGAGERAIEHDDPGGGEPVARPLLRLDRECADLGDDEPWPLLRGKSFG